MLVGVTACASSIWLTDTSVKCITASGTGPALAISTAVGSVYGCLSRAFTFDNPVLVRTNILVSPNGPATGGNTVSIYGTNFGATDTSLTAQVGLTACGTVSWSSVSLIACLVTGKVSTTYISKEVGQPASS